MGSMTFNSTNPIKKVQLDDIKHLYDWKILSTRHQLSWLINSIGIIEIYCQSIHLFVNFCLFFLKKLRNKQNIRRLPVKMPDDRLSVEINIPALIFSSFSCNMWTRERIKFHHDGKSRSKFIGRENSKNLNFVVQRHLLEMFEVWIERVKWEWSNPYITTVEKFDSHQKYTDTKQKYEWGSPSSMLTGVI